MANRSKHTCGDCCRRVCGPKAMEELTVHGIGKQSLHCIAAQAFASTRVAACPCRQYTTTPLPPGGCQHTTACHLSSAPRPNANYASWGEATACERGNTWQALPGKGRCPPCTATRRSGITYQHANHQHHPAAHAGMPHHIRAALPARRSAGCSPRPHALAAPSRGQRTRRTST